MPPSDREWPPVRRWTRGYVERSGILHVRLPSLDLAVRAAAQGTTGLSPRLQQLGLLGAVAVVASTRLGPDRTTGLDVVLRVTALITAVYVIPLFSRRGLLVASDAGLAFIPVSWRSAADLRKQVFATWDEIEVVKAGSGRRFERMVVRIAGRRVYLGHEGAEVVRAGLR